jgi:expansin
MPGVIRTSVTPFGEVCEHRAVRALVISLTLATVAACRAGTSSRFGDVQHGEGTYYDATGDGACSFGPSPRDLDVAALNDVQWDSAALCGACAAVTGPSGTVTVRLVDRCPECRAGDLDLSPQAFAKVAELSLGRVPISWQLTTCDVSDNLRYFIKDGSSQWWTAIQVRNHRVPVHGLGFLRSGSWVELPRQEYNFFLAAQGTGPGQIQVRVTSVTGQILEDTLGGPNAEATYEGAAQFDGP